MSDTDKLFRLQQRRIKKAELVTSAYNLMFNGKTTDPVILENRRHTYFDRKADLAKLDEEIETELQNLQKTDDADTTLSI